MTTYDLKMKKTIPSKEVLEQYIYDYGIDKTAQIFHISTEELDKKINWSYCGFQLIFLSSSSADM